MLNYCEKTILFSRTQWSLKNSFLALSLFLLSQIASAQHQLKPLDELLNQPTTLAPPEALGAGMIPKVECALGALSGGVLSVSVSSSIILDSSCAPVS